MWLGKLHEILECKVEGLARQAAYPHFCDVASWECFVVAEFWEVTYSWALIDSTPAPTPNNNINSFPFEFFLPAAIF